eukprot:s3931_g4.t1
MFYSHMRLRYGSGLLKQDVMDHPFMFGHLRCRPRCIPVQTPQPLRLVLAALSSPKPRCVLVQIKKTSHV